MGGGGAPIGGPPGRCGPVGGGAFICKMSQPPKLA